MNLLAIDSSAKILSIAVSNGDKIHYMETDAGMKHSALVMGCIDDLMKEAKLKPNDLNGVLCMGGPGSFTGLRIGYSICKGLALSLSIPFAPVSALECISYNHEGNVLSVIESRKNAWYCAFFKDGIRQTPDMELGTEEIIKQIGEEITIKGYGAFSFYNSLPADLREKIILKNENMGYAKEIIYIAKKSNIFNNDNSVFLYSGPDYIRDAQTGN